MTTHTYTETECLIQNLRLDLTNLGFNASVSEIAKKTLRVQLNHRVAEISHSNLGWTLIFCKTDNDPGYFFSGIEHTYQIRRLLDRQALIDELNANKIDYSLSTKIFQGVDVHIKEDYWFSICPSHRENYEFSLTTHKGTKVEGAKWTETLEDTIALIKKVIN